MDIGSQLRVIIVEPEPTMIRPRPPVAGKPVERVDGDEAQRRPG